MKISLMTNKIGVDYSIVLLEFSNSFKKCIWGQIDYFSLQGCEDLWPEAAANFPFQKLRWFDHSNSLFFIKTYIKTVLSIRNKSLLNTRLH